MHFDTLEMQFPILGVKTTSHTNITPGFCNNMRFCNQCLVTCDKSMSHVHFLSRLTFGSVSRRLHILSQSQSQSPAAPTQACVCLRMQTQATTSNDKRQQQQQRQQQQLAFVERMFDLHSLKTNYVCLSTARSSSV